uniref:PDZ domain protein n=1 Tax=Musca domestica TaxID=7370 RepID=A0A1I8M3T0_MUSDO
MDDMPDLSHLTPHERMQIENVLRRQKQEEEQQNEIMRRKQDEVMSLEMQIRQRSEQQKKAGIELEATCHICLKTKFADGVGHICHYCNTRCCARCGGKVTLRSNKVIWVCILCRKKQELLSKTGQWINKATIQQDGFIRRNEPDGSSDISQQAVVDPHDALDKRPKLERTRSAAEKENLPLQRSGSMLKRQYSQQEQTTNQRDMMGPNMGMDIMSPGQRQRMQPMTPQHMQQQHQQQQQQMSQQGQYNRGQQGHYGGGSGGSGPGMHHQKDEDPRLYQVIWVCILCRKKQELLSKTGQWINKATIQQDGFIRRNEPDGSSDISQQAVVDPHDALDKRPKLERTRSAAEKENLPLQRSGSMLKRQYSQQEQTTNQRDMMGPNMGMDIMSPGQRQRMQPMTPQHMQQQHQQQQQQMSQQGQYNRGQQGHYGGGSGGSGPGMHHQKDEDPRLYQGEIDGLMKQHPHLAHPSQRQQQQYQYQQQQQQHQMRGQQQQGPTNTSSVTYATLQHPQQQQQRLPTSSAAQQHHQQHQQQQHHQTHPHHYSGVGSSSQLSAAGHHQTPASSAAISSNAALVSVSTSATSSQGYQKPPPIQRNLTISGGHAMDPSTYNARRHLNVSQYAAQQQRSFSSYEDEIQHQVLSIRGKKPTGGPSNVGSVGVHNALTSGDLQIHANQPVNWQISADNARMIGHMILRKYYDGEDILGLKVLGGQPLPYDNSQAVGVAGGNNGIGVGGGSAAAVAAGATSVSYGAIVEKVKRGSVADTEGHIQPGDEIVKWNGHVLQNKTADEVYDIIDESRLDAQVELVVSRPINASTSTSSTTTTTPGTSAALATSASLCSTSVPNAVNATAASTATTAIRKVPSSTLASYIAGSAVVSSGGRYVQRK